MTRIGLIPAQLEILSRRASKRARAFNNRIERPVANTDTIATYAFGSVRVFLYAASGTTQRN